MLTVAAEVRADDSPDAVTDGGGGAGMRRASNRLMVVPAGGQSARLRRSGQVVLCGRAFCWPGLAGTERGSFFLLLQAAGMRLIWSANPVGAILNATSADWRRAWLGWHPQVATGLLSEGPGQRPLRGGWSPALSRGRLAGGW
jgi:hypothetical protein